MRPKKLERVERTVSKYHVIAPHEAVVLLRKCADDIFHGKDFSSSAKRLATHDAEQRAEIERRQAQLATAKRELEHWTHDSFKRREAALREALQGILDIGKRDMSNPKYDGYFAAAREALKEAS